MPRHYHLQTGITIPTNNPSCVLIRISATLCVVPKIAVTFSDEELAQVKRDAGLVPLSAWIRNCTVGKGGGNGSASHQNVSRIPESSVSGRRAGASERRSTRRGRGRLREIEDTTNATFRKLSRTASHSSGSNRGTQRTDVASVSGEFSASVTKENFAEFAANIPNDEVDSWARSLSREVLPSHSGDWRICLCGNCLDKRKTLGVAYGEKPKNKR
jgi:hypothetical protein